jgi:hypothetical protein
VRLGSWHSVAETRPPGGRGPPLNSSSRGTPRHEAGGAVASSRSAAAAENPRRQAPHPRSPRWNGCRISCSSCSSDIDVSLAPNRGRWEAEDTGLRYPDMAARLSVSPTRQESGPEERARSVFAEHLSALGPDESPDVESLLRRHPELARELRSLAEAWELFRAVEARLVPGRASLDERLRAQVGEEVDPGVSLQGPAPEPPNDSGASSELLRRLGPPAPRHSPSSSPTSRTAASRPGAGTLATAGSRTCRTRRTCTTTRGAISSP